jgi:hypothetical protein
MLTVCAGLPGAGKSTLALTTPPTSSWERWEPSSSRSGTTSLSTPSTDPSRHGEKQWAR